MIDLHSHTNESDGTSTPAELIEEALRVPLDALSITDHDTFAGYELAHPIAAQAGLDLIRGLELTTHYHGPLGARQIHLLGYWFEGEPSARFLEFLRGVQQARRDRNARILDQLRPLGIDIAMEELERMGRSVAGRTHMARILVQRGYVASFSEAFTRYLGDDSPGFVEQEHPTIEEGIAEIRASGGVSSLAHPVRLARGDRERTEALVAYFAQCGLQAIECYHSDQNTELTAQYLELANRYSLRITGGSDYHAANKPQIRLGTGFQNNVAIPLGLLDQFRAPVVR